MTITPEESQSYQWALEGAHNMDLVLALRRHVANEMRLEFGNEHELYRSEDISDLGMYCPTCGSESNWDERHQRTDADWERAAHEALKGVKEVFEQETIVGRTK